MSKHLRLLGSDTMFYRSLGEKMDTVVRWDLWLRLYQEYIFPLDFPLDIHDVLFRTGGTRIEELS